MRTWLLVSAIGFVACGSQSHEVSKVKYTRTTCNDCGIAAAPGGEYGFTLPDSERGLPSAPERAEAPAPTCQLVAEAVVSFELGNYADPAERAPHVARVAKQCAAAELARDDRQCVVDAADVASAAHCAPSLFPDVRVEYITPQQCERAARLMRDQLEQQLRANPRLERALYEKQLAAAIESCRHDRWNAAMYSCAQSYVPLHATSCMYTQPAVIWQRLAARLETARAAAR